METFLARNIERFHEVAEITQRVGKISNLNQLKLVNGTLKRQKQVFYSSCEKATGLTDR